MRRVHVHEQHFLIDVEFRHAYAGRKRRRLLQSASEALPHVAGARARVNRTQWLVAARMPRNDDVGIDHCGETPQQARRDERHVARDHERPVAGRMHDGGVDSAERPGVRHLVRDDAQASGRPRRIVAADHEYRICHLSQSFELPVDDRGRPNHERALVHALKACRASPGQNGGSQTALFRHSQIVKSIKPDRASAVTGDSVHQDAVLSFR